MVNRLRDSIVKVAGFEQRNPPARAYVHRFGLEESFGNDWWNAINHLSEIYNPLMDRIRRSKNSLISYVIAITWGNNGNKMVDFFGLTRIEKDWSANPEIVSWVTKDGILVPEIYPGIKAISCGDGIKILAKELISREKTRDLAEYKSHEQLEKIFSEIRKN